VGYRDDVADQLAGLCGHLMVDLRPQTVIQTAQRLRQSPGFIAFGGRFLYVTPSLIAQVAFQSAWGRWIAPDPPGFARAASVFDRTVHRPSAERGSDRDASGGGGFFQGWAGSLAPPDLGREEALLRLLRLVEVQPDRCCPSVPVVEGCTTEELSTDPPGYEAEQARRQLVWLAEKLTHFGNTSGRRSDSAATGPRRDRAAP
jgi:hypothetical protein